MVEFDIEAFREGSGRDTLTALLALARDYRDDPDCRARLEADPRAELAARDVDVVPASAEVRVKVNTPEVFHLVMAADPNSAVSDQLLGDVAGGSSASTVATAGSGGTASTTPSCLGCVSSVSTAGSAGSAGCADS